MNYGGKRLASSVLVLESRTYQKRTQSQARRPSHTEDAARVCAPQPTAKHCSNVRHGVTGRVGVHFLRLLIAETHRQQELLHTSSCPLPVPAANDIKELAVLKLLVSLRQLKDALHKVAA